MLQIIGMVRFAFLSSTYNFNIFTISNSCQQLNSQYMLLIIGFYINKNVHEKCNVIIVNYYYCSYNILLYFMRT